LVSEQGYKSKMKSKTKKGQLSLNDAPNIVLLIGLVFLVMATVAFIGQTLGDSIKDVSDTGTVINETGAFINTSGYTLDEASAFEFKDPSVTAAYNYTDGTLISASEYDLSDDGVLINATATTYDNVSVSYTYTYYEKTDAYNSTVDLNTEIEQNTSIAGIVLTISLVGIVLTVLIGIFVGFRKRRGGL